MTSTHHRAVFCFRSTITTLTYSTSPARCRPLIHTHVAWSLCLSVCDERKPCRAADLTAMSCVTWTCSRRLQPGHRTATALTSCLRCSDLPAVDIINRIRKGAVAIRPLDTTSCAATCHYRCRVLLCLDVAAGGIKRYLDPSVCPSVPA